MRSAAPPKKKKIHLHTYPAGQKTGGCVASLSRHTQSTGSTCLVLTHRADRLGALRSVKRGAAGLAQSDGGRSCGDTPSLPPSNPTPSRFVAIRGVLAGFCGDVATPSRTPSPAPSQTCVWLSPTPQNALSPRGFAPHRVVLHVPHRVGHPKTHTCAPIGTLYRNILSQIR